MVEKREVLDKICSFCGEAYAFTEGHNYNKCVEACQRRLDKAVRSLSTCQWALEGAKEVQKQNWWVESKEGSP